MNSLRPYFGRLVFTLLGFIAAILFMTIGFAKTMLLILCCGAGFAIGAYKDKGLRLPEWIFFWRDKW